ncbi:hypothetical protein PBAL39_24545 [Pedobacter sp. BAL39]|nr:hypothetical protein PBAL39_24545 [Pedobacter sp. BAL39]
MIYLGSKNTAFSVNDDKNLFVKKSTIPSADTF